MDILVLDTIHGGRELARHFSLAGHRVDQVDVYRGTEGISVEEAGKRRYNLIVAPVHLDPDHPLLQHPAVPVISHHEAVRRLLGTRVPHPMIEITGAQGKTTTAHALASLMFGTGILHTSRGTYRYPERELLEKKSITPASLLAAAQTASAEGGWLIAEESLGVSGAGDLAILTSAEDYRIAAGKKSAFHEKVASVERARQVITAPGITLSHPSAIGVEAVVQCSGSRCQYSYRGIRGEFENPLCTLSGYRTPLMLAAAAALLLSIDPAPLEGFQALPGRMAVTRENDILVVDNANSGTNAMTTIEAAWYARSLAGTGDLTLVIGEESRAICEGFAPESQEEAIGAIQPQRTIRVGEKGDAQTLDGARSLAISATKRGSIVLAVKTWR
jgi:coenzyme F430 synthetase